MRQVANGLSAAGHHEDALTVEEAQLSMLRRIGASEYNILGVQNNLAARMLSLDGTMRHRGYKETYIMCM